MAAQHPEVSVRADIAWAAAAFPQVATTTRVLRIARRKPLAAISFLLVALLGIIAAGAPIFARYDPERGFMIENPNFDPASTAPEALYPTALDDFAAPSFKHWFGTDDDGRDIWSRIVWGTRRSLGIGVGALAIATVVGTILGVVSAYFGGLLDLLLQRALDAIQAFPALLLLILIASTQEPSILNLIIGLGFIGITQVSRIVRSTVFATREQPYVEGARVIGASDIRIMVQHILPNIVAPIIVVFTIGLGAVIIAEAGLAVLALAPPGVSWGDMLREGKNALQSSPWMAVFSGGAITLSVLAFNLAGDGLRDIFDPRLRT